MQTKLRFCLLLFFNCHAGLFVAAAPTTISSSIPSTELDNSISIAPEDKEPIPSTTTIATTTSAKRSHSLNVEKELNKIADACITDKEYEEIYGNTVKEMYATMLAHNAFKESTEVIGLEELRKLLKFAPPPPWKIKDYKDFDASDEDLAAAPTLEVYYNLKEPRSYHRVIDNLWFFEHNIKTTIDYLDKRFPAIRKIYKQELKRFAPPVIDRKAVDDLIAKFREIDKRIDEVIEKMKNNYKCNDDDVKSTTASTISTTTTTPTSTAITTTTTPPPPSELEKRLVEISKSCLNETDFEKLKTFQTTILWSFVWSIREVLTTIGLQELRAVLKFAPLPPWKHYNETQIGDEGLDTVTNLEAYYNLQEPQSKSRSLDSRYLSEKSLQSFIEIFDNRVPAIRSVYRSEMERIRLSGPPELDKETIDLMINEFGSINYRVYEAAKELKDEYRRACR